MSGKEELIKGRYRKMDIIGEGAYGTVVKCLDVQTGEPVAIKISRYGACEGVASSILRETNILQALDHPNVVPLLDVIYSPSEKAHVVYLVFPFLKEDLAKQMRRVKFLSEQAVKNSMYQMVSGLAYMHQHQIFHRDLKPQNILIDEDGRAIVADLGLARQFEYPLQPMSREIGTLWYRPIEVLLGNLRYGLEVDAWSLGCIFYEMVSGEPLFKTDSEIDTIFSIFERLGTPTQSEDPELTDLPDFKSTFPKFKKQQITCPKLSEHGNDLLNQLLQLNPTKRISMDAALKHPYFKYMKPIVSEWEK